MKDKKVVEEGLNKVNEATQKVVEANQIVIDTIMNNFLLTWKWWIGIALFIVPWIFWAIFRKKESSGRILLAGFAVIIFSFVLDSFGVSNGKWLYPVRIIPSVLIYFPFQLGIVPVMIMFLLQLKPNFNPFLKAIMFGGFSAYVGMPIMAMLDLYKKVDWAYTYSFFILIVLYLVAHYFSRINSFVKIQ